MLLRVDTTCTVYFLCSNESSNQNPISRSILIPISISFPKLWGESNKSKSESKNILLEKVFNYKGDNKGEVASKSYAKFINQFYAIYITFSRRKLHVCNLNTSHIFTCMHDVASPVQINPISIRYTYVQTCVPTYCSRNASASPSPKD